MQDCPSLKIMGILNCTPDSFSDGGKFYTLDAAVNHAAKMVQDGADIIDIGGESTRPFAKPISIQQELDRVLPVIEKINRNINITISIDTRHAKVMCEAIKAGASLINDISALADPLSAGIVAKHNIPVCIMHMQGDPTNMQQQPNYQDVVVAVYEFLSQRIDYCLSQGINQQQIIVDPGFGFGKTLAHNILLLKNLNVFKRLNCPILVGVSRKSMLGQILNDNNCDRTSASIAAAMIAYQNGANILRVHDVLETAQALAIARAIAYNFPL